MKDYFSFNHLIECFYFLPSINYNWMRTNKEYSWELNFVWLFWQFSIGNVRINLKKLGYH